MRVEHGYPCRSVLIWAMAILCTNQVVHDLGKILAATITEQIPDIFAINLFQYLAWYAIFTLVRSSDPLKTAHKRDFIVITGLLLLTLFPSIRTYWITAPGIAFYVLLCVRDVHLRAAAT